jgi:hypothetical protein
VEECRLERVNCALAPLFLPLQEEGGKVHILGSTGCQADQVNGVDRGTLGLSAHTPQGHQAGGYRLVHPFPRSLTGSEARNGIFQLQGCVGKRIRDIRHVHLQGSV